MKSKEGSLGKCTKRRALVSEGPGFEFEGLARFSCYAVGRKVLGT
jgi:hypothetical protein